MAFDNSQPVGDPAEPHQPSFGEELRRLRKARNLSGEDLVKAMKKHAGGAVKVPHWANIYKIEVGERPFPEAALPALAKALDVPLGDLKALLPKREAFRSTLAAAKRNTAQRRALAMSAQLLEDADIRERERLHDAQSAVRDDLINPLLAIVQSIPDIQVMLSEGVSAEPDQARDDDTIKERLNRTRRVLSQGLIKVAVEAAGMKGVPLAAAGGASGALAAFGLYTGVAALGVASTGTAITSLTGAAATSATLAALGGGSLAAGGWGVVGGTALLAGITAVPLLGGAIFGAVIADKYAYSKLLEQADQLSEAELQLRHLQEVARIRWDWAAEQVQILTTVRISSLNPLARLKSAAEAPDGKQRSWEEVCNAYRGTARDAHGDAQLLLRALTCAVEAMSLPTWMPIADTTTQSGLDTLPPETRATIESHYRALRDEALDIQASA